MNCDEARQLLQLSFGSDGLPRDLLDHVSECESCRAYYEDLNWLGDELGSDDDFALSAAEIERAVAEVDTRTAPEPTRVVPVEWLRPLTRVAATIVIVAASFSAYQLGRLDNGNGAAVSDTAYEYGSIASVWESDLDEELDDTFVSILVNDYGGDGYFGAGESLLGDISEEELEYLVENFEVGELL